MNKTGLALASTLDLRTLVQTVTDAATQLSGAKFGAFFYNATNAEGDSYRLYSLSGAPREVFERFGSPRATALFGPTFRGDGPIRCDDVLKDPRYGKMGPHRGMPKGHLPVRSYLAVAVVSRSGEVIGGLFFGHPEVGIFDDRSRAEGGQERKTLDSERLRVRCERMSERGDCFDASSFRRPGMPSSMVAGTGRRGSRKRSSQALRRSSKRLQPGPAIEDPRDTNGYPAGG